MGPTFGISAGHRLEQDRSYRLVYPRGVTKSMLTADLDQSVGQTH